MDKRYDILELISQRENSEMSAENADMVSIASIFGNTKGNGGENEAEPSKSSNDVTDINEREKRIAEKWSKDNDCWIPFANLFSIGMTGPSGSESDTFISNDGYVYKVNNALS